MIWLTWRQFRTQTLAAVAVLAVAAVYLLTTGTQLRHSYTADLATCGQSGNCSDVLGELQSRYNGPLDLIALLLIAAPAVVGIFWGAPQIAGELERGTHYLAWNQSTTRTRWLATKLILVGLASVATVGLLSLLVTWWAGPLDAISGSRWGTQTFDGRDVVPLGYAAFAFALGVVLGLLTRRTLPAMAATLVIFVAVQVLMGAVVRPNLLPATTVAVPVDQSTMSHAVRFDRSVALTGPVTIDLPAPTGSWLLSETPALNSSGRPIQTSEIITCWSRTVTGAIGKAGPSGFDSLGSCLAPQDLHVEITYQPAGRYWQLQWIEAAFYTVLASLLVAVCFWRIRRLRG